MKSTIYFFTMLALCCYSSLESMQTRKVFKDGDDRETVPVSFYAQRRSDVLSHYKTIANMAKKKNKNSDIIRVSGYLQFKSRL